MEEILNMTSKRYKLAIVTRSFWPKSQIIGEALLQLAEMAALNDTKTSVITQSGLDLCNEAKVKDRGKNVDFSVCKARSDSSSHILIRLLDALIFMLWVFWTLILKHPKKVYVSTNPPVVVPFIVLLYSKLFRASYVYHLQDIHPEAANIVFKLNPILFGLLKWIDSIVMRNAEAIITLTDTMKYEIIARSKTQAPIVLVDNPSVISDQVVTNKTKGFVFCGNAGRLQRIPLLIESIKKYREQGGLLPFVFAGGGVYKKDIEELARTYNNIDYLGVLSAAEASFLTSSYEWGLLPIDDEVTLFAFPSKTSSYVASGTKILSICSEDTSVARWVADNQYGINVNPNEQEIISTFFKIEHQECRFRSHDFDKEKFSIHEFVKKIFSVIYGAPCSNQGFKMIDGRAIN